MKPMLEAIGTGDAISDGIERRIEQMNIVNSIPGGWYGNEPGFLATDPGCGNVCIAPERLHVALQWIMRRATVLSVEAGHYQDKGFDIQYRLKRYDKAFAQLRAN